jgi:hypothetical protein
MQGCAVIAVIGGLGVTAAVIVGHSGDRHPNGHMSARYAGICPALLRSVS